MKFTFEDFEINPIHEGDAWKICDFVIANADRLKRFFPKTLEQNQNPTLSEIYVRNRVKAFQNKELFVFTLKHSESRKLLGLLILKHLDWESKQGEFAYAVDYNHTNQGLVSKSIGILTQYAFKKLGLETLQIIAHKTNKASIKVAINNDFKWIKTMENAFTPPGEKPLDMELYERYKN
ncbi:MAG: GNAT family N-acetyltransferase [Psychroserpens sp.]|nr:GNAT family N-acetyltransferase [Psychroserpens sp.]